MREPDARSPSGDEVDRHLTMLAQAVDEAGLPNDRWSLKRRQAVRLLVAGSTDQAERAATEALAAGRASHQPDAGLIYAAQLGMIRMVQGRLAEIEPALGTFVQRDPNAITRGLVAFLYCDLGRLAEAEALLARDAGNDFTDVPYEVAWLSVMTAYARVAAETRHVKAAELLHERLSPWHGQIDCPGNTVNGSVALYLGALARMAGRFDAAEAHLEEALNAHERIRAPYWIAATHLELGRAFVERGRPGDRDRARQLLEKALAPTSAALGPEAPLGRLDDGFAASVSEAACPADRDDVSARL
jgi:tetratricopeptide (TPR) repeat protein